MMREWTKEREEAKREAKEAKEARLIGTGA